MSTELSVEGKRHIRIARLSWLFPVAGFCIMFILSANPGRITASRLV